MRDRLPQPAAPRRATRSGSFTPGQKAVTLVGVVALVIGGFFFATWASKPSYAPLFSNLSSTDASAIVESLQTRPARRTSWPTAARPSWCRRTRCTTCACS